jgi:hypothetical protein
MSKKKESNRLTIGGSVNAGGDFVGGDKITTIGPGSVYAGGNISGRNFVTGNSNVISQNEGMQEKLFEDLLKRIEQRPNTPPEDKEELADVVEEFKTEAKKGEQAQEKFLELRLKNIKRIAPDIAEVLIATVTNPAAGFALIVKKVAEKAAASAGTP